MHDDTDEKKTGRTETGLRAVPGDGQAIAGVGTYESGDGVVFYDSENPLAWVQSRVTVRLEEMV